MTPLALQKKFINTPMCIIRPFGTIQSILICCTYIVPRNGLHENFSILKDDGLSSSGRMYGCIPWLLNPEMIGGIHLLLWMYTTWKLCRNNALDTHAEQLQIISSTQLGMFIPWQLPWRPIYAMTTAMDDK